MTKVTEYLREQGMEFTVLEHARAESAMQEAFLLGTSASHVAKAVVVDTDEGRLIAVLPAYRRLDEHAVRDHLGRHHVRLATEEEIEADYPDFELGAFPPVPALVGAPLVVDEELMRHEHIVLAAGSQRLSVEMATRDLFGDADVTVAPISRHPEDADMKDSISF